jgi:peptidylprolyl isomerase
MPTPRLILPSAATLAVALLLGGCGSSSSSSGDSAIQPAPSGGATTPATTASTPTTPANPALAKKPTVAKGSGPPPTKLVVRDLVTGTGPAAKAGQMLTVQYVGVLFKTGKQFDASWDSGQPFNFTLGTGSVIKGWDQGIVGMHVGGRRQLIIPAGLAYAATARPGIPANSPLIFDVDLLAAQ